MCRAPCFADGGLTNLCRGRSLLQFEVAQNCAGVVLCFNLRSHKIVQGSFLASI